MEQSFLKLDLNINYEFPFSLNKETFDAVIDFYGDSNSSVCFIEGAAGTFKTKLVDESLKSLSDEVLLFKFKCFEGNTLDDIFLSFFEDLKKYSEQKKVSFTKLDTNSFSQRINTYFRHVNRPCVLIIDSLEEIFSKTNNLEKDAILSYIKYLALINKFKLVIISQHFDKDFCDSFSDVHRVSLQPYSQEQLEAYFNHYSVLCSQEDLIDFYKIAGGNIFFIQQTVSILQTLKISLRFFINEFLSKRLLFEDFLFQKFSTFILNDIQSSLNNIVLFNIGLNPEYLYKNKLLTKDQLYYFIDKKILSYENGYVYIKQYLKKYLLNRIPHFEKIKLHKYWQTFYESQLPLPPNKRDILISRSTMRAQIEYHSSFAAKDLPKEKVNADMSLISYLNSNLTNWNIKNTNIKENKPVEKNKEKVVENNKKSLEKYELTKEELSLLSHPIDLRVHNENIAKEKLQRTFEQKEAAQRNDNTLEGLYKQANEAKEVHEIEKAFNIYCLMLSLKNSNDFADYEISILENLAECAQKLNKMSDAIDFYNKLTDLYAARKDYENVNDIKLKIALVYKATYKINQARVILESFIKKKTPASDNIVFKSYIELAQIEEEQSNVEHSIEYYRKAMIMPEESVKIDSDYLSNAYFKYALLLDDYGSIDAALKYYQMCITTAEKPAICVSCSYTNVAEIVQEASNYKMAYDYFNYALKVDIELNNYEGVYYICLKLAELGKTTGSGDVLNWLLKALSAAKHSHDKKYITNSYVLLGEHYLRNNQLVKAFKSFSVAKKFVEFLDDAQEKSNYIELKLADLKNNIPKDIFDKYIKNAENNEA